MLSGPQYASGGFVADSSFSGGTVSNGSQQQFLVRNINLDGWSNGVWNQVVSGDPGAPPVRPCGEDIFFQNEMPYDPPSQAAWMSGPATDGYPAFQMAQPISVSHPAGSRVSCESRRPRDRPGAGLPCWPACGRALTTGL